MRALRKGRNAALNLFSILNLDRAARHITQEKNIKKLIETSTEVTDSSIEMAAKEAHSISNNERDINPTFVGFDCIQNSRGWQTKERVVAVVLRRLGK